MIRALSGTLSLLLLLTVAACGERQEAGSGGTGNQQDSESQSEGLDVGDPMRGFEAQNLDGTIFRFTEQFQGRPVLLNLWATWCGPCRAEIPELQRLHEEHSGSGFAVLGVSVDDPGARDEIRAFLEQRNVTYPNVHDPEGKVAEMFNAFAIPTSALVDRSGRIVWKKVGIIRFDDPELKNAMEQAVGREGAAADQERGAA